MKHCIVIRGAGCISALGHDDESIGDSYLSSRSNFRLLESTWQAPLSEIGDRLINKIALEQRIYKDLDRSVLMAIYVARTAIQEAGWANQPELSINIGSSRGATASFEKYFLQFQNTGTVSPSASPITTLGNISSWVAQDLKSQGAMISHSVTCSTGLQSIANAFAWLKSGMAQRFLAGASEAPLTPFTIAQMKALGIYSSDETIAYPCRPINREQQNTFVLGEGAAVFALEKVSMNALKKEAEMPIIIESVGLGMELISSKTGLSKNGDHFRLAIETALKSAKNRSDIDLVVMHAPGTVAGDNAELNALRAIFGKKMPMLSSTKWMTGHTFGASGCLSLNYAIHVLKTQNLADFSYDISVATEKKRLIRRVLITAAGFGGNAAAMIVSRPDL